MGFAYAAIGDLPSAAREFTMGGTEAEAKNNLGFAYERRGDMSNAYDLYLQSVRIDPTADRARSNLVHAAVVLGRPVPPEATAAPKPAGNPTSTPMPTPTADPPAAAPADPVPVSPIFVPLTEKPEATP